VRHARALARDGADLFPYLREWWRGEDAHFAADATRDHVDLVVDGSEWPAAGYVPLVPYRIPDAGGPGGRRRKAAARSR
jgi:hypothetical protein